METKNEKLKTTEEKVANQQPHMDSIKDILSRFCLFISRETTKPLKVTVLQTNKWFELLKSPS